MKLTMYGQRSLMSEPCEITLAISINVTYFLLKIKASLRSTGIYLTYNNSTPKRAGIVSVFVHFYISNTNHQDAYYQLFRQYVSR